MRKLFTTGMLITVFTVVGISAQVETDAATQRSIPVKLWTGAEWDGSQQLKMRPIYLSFGNGGQKTIVGPMPWTQPSAGETRMFDFRRTNGTPQRTIALTTENLDFSYWGWRIRCTYIRW
jgi:hypothetical protein